MIIFEITAPGTWLDYDDEDWAHNIQMQLESLKSHFFEANIALNLFMDAQLRPIPEPNYEEWINDSHRRTEIYLDIRQSYASNDKSQEYSEEIQYESEVRFKQEKWASGQIPREFKNRLPIIYARAFLYALDTFDKFLGILANEKNVPEGVKIFHEKMAESFPDLRYIRNTAHHPEDRMRGLGAGQKPLDLKPIETSFINAPAGGVIVLDNLDGSRYGCTLSTGHFSEIDVSPESMQRLQGILEAVLSLFKWCGPKEHSPHA